MYLTFLLLLSVLTLFSSTKTHAHPSLPPSKLQARQPPPFHWIQDPDPLPGSVAVVDPETLEELAWTVQSWFMNVERELRAGTVHPDADDPTAVTRMEALSLAALGLTIPDPALRLNVMFVGRQVTPNFTPPDLTIDQQPGDDIPEAFHDNLELRHQPSGNYAAEGPDGSQWAAAYQIVRVADDQDQGSSSSSSGSDTQSTTTGSDVSAQTHVELLTFQGVVYTAVAVILTTIATTG